MGRRRMEIFEGIVGKKGEIYVRKRFRELMGLKPGDRVEFIVKGDTVIFRKKPNATDLLRRKRIRVDISEVLELRKSFEEELVSGD